MGGEAGGASIARDVRGATASGFGWDVSGSPGVHQSDLCVRNTIDASLGSASPAAFDVGGNRQQAISLNADCSYAVTDQINVADGAECRDEHFGATQGDPASWAIGPCNRQGLFAGSRGLPGYGPLHAGDWNRYNVAGYCDVELTVVDDCWTLGGVLRVENFQDFGSTTNGKVSGRNRVHMGAAMLTE